MIFFFSPKMINLTCRPFTIKYIFTLRHLYPHGITVLSNDHIFPSFTSYVCFVFSLYVNHLPLSPHFVMIHPQLCCQCENKKSFILDLSSCSCCLFVGSVCKARPMLKSSLWRLFAIIGGFQRAATRQILKPKKLLMISSSVLPRAHK